MTPAYKARREAKHAAQAKAKIKPVTFDFMEGIDLTPRMASHAFVGLKMHPQGNGGRNNTPGHSWEHKQANLDNATFKVELPKDIGGISETGGPPTAIEAPMGVYHDFVAMNANECILDPTPEERDRILKESEL